MGNALDIHKWVDPEDTVVGKQLAIFFTSILCTKACKNYFA
jgi:hypothetical protein